MHLVCTHEQNQCTIFNKTITLQLQYAKRISSELHWSFFIFLDLSEKKHLVRIGTIKLSVQTSILICQRFSFLLNWMLAVTLFAMIVLSDE